MKSKLQGVISVAVLTLATSFAAHAGESSTSKSAAKVQAGEFRMNSIKSPAHVKALKNLSSDDKKLALENLKRVPPTDGWWVLGNSPDVQAMLQMNERWLLSTLYPDSYQGVAFSPTNIMTILVCRHFNHEYGEGLLAAVTAGVINAQGEDAQSITRDMTKLQMLDYPDANFYSPEESLTIKFTNAALNTDMTDELFLEARKTWGDQKTIGYLAWIGFISQMVIIMDAAGLEYDMTFNFPEHTLTKEHEQKVIEIERVQKKTARKAWLEFDEIADEL